MSTRNVLSKKNQFFISKHRFLELRNLCLQYHELKRKNPKDHRVSIIEQAAAETDSVLGKYVLYGVVNGYSYDAVNAYMRVPGCKGTYYNTYHKFFKILDSLRD